MQPQRSVRNTFSPLGRLENAWAAGLADNDPGQGLTRLREVLRRFEERPEETASLWPPFQESLLGARFLPLLEEADLDRLRDLGEQMAGTGRTGLHGSWLQLVHALAARSALGDRQRAFDLLTRLYHAALATEEARFDAAATLARWGADDDAHCEVYAHLLGRPARVPQEVLDHVGRVLTVGFADSGDGALTRVSRAAGLARRLADSCPGVPGVDRALGYGELLLHHRPVPAAHHFESAVRADPGDTSALHGLLAARLHAGQYTRAIGEVAGREGSLTARAAQLLDLCRMLAWLEEVPLGVSDQVPRPLDSVRIAAIESGPDTGPWQRYALGRTYLLEGDQDRAREQLVPVSDALPDRADLAYHAAWAQLLAGDRDGAADRCAERLAAERPDRSVTRAFACLLTDADPDRQRQRQRQPQPRQSEDPQRQNPSADETQGLAPVMRARLLLADGQGPPALPEWEGLDLRGAELPELLEALRTVLGVEVARGRPQAAARLTGLPLFMRLPYAEQLVWHGVLALPADLPRGRDLLDRARSLGRDRAAVVLAVLELRAGRAAVVGELLDGVRGRKAELLRALAELRLGRTDTAEIRLTGLMSRGLPRARHALGALGLRQAAVHWASGRPDEAVRCAEQAAARLTDAALAPPDVLPPVPAEARSLSRAARLVAERAARPGTGRSPWRAVRHRARTARLLGFAQLLAEPEHSDPVLAEALTDWTGLPQAGPLAATLARARALTSDPDDRAELTEALAHLADRHPLPDVRRPALDAARLTALTNGAEPAADVAVENPLLALEAAMSALASGRHETAVQLLRQAAKELPSTGGQSMPTLAPGAPRASHALHAPRASDALATPSTTPPDSTPPGNSRAATDGAVRADARRVAAFLADALDGRPHDKEPPDAGTPGLTAPLLVAQAAGLVRTDPSKAAAALTGTLAEHDLAGLVDVGRALPALCARAARGKRREGPAKALAVAVRRQALGAAGSGGPALLTLARCATAVGDHDTAEALWRRVLRETPEAGEEYGAYLCHRAVSAYAGGDREAALELLREAARLLPAAHPVHREAADLERDDRVDTLLAVLLPDGAPGLERRGRYRVLEDAAAGHPDLWSALAADDADRTIRALARCLYGHAANIPLLHTLAVLYREETFASLARTGTPGPELTTATALWTLLLAHPGFWQETGTPDKDAARLREELSGELLQAHRTHGARALDQRQETAARTHLRCLEAVQAGPGATGELLADGPLAGAVPDGVDGGVFAAFSARATSLLDEWATDLVRTATQSVDDPAALDRLPRGIDRDYEAGIDILDAAVRQGFTPTSVLCTALEWHNTWQTRLYELGERERMREVVGSAARFADLLAEQCAEGRPYLPENQALGMHFVDRGLLDTSAEQGVRFLERARAWDPSNPSVDKLLERRREEALFGKALEHVRAKRYDRALKELDRVPRNASTRSLLDTLRISSLINKGYQELDGYRFETAETCMRQGLRVAQEMASSDTKLLEDAQKALTNVAGALNGRGVTVFEQAAARLESFAGTGFTTTVLDAIKEAEASAKLFREALRVNPAHPAARSNLTSAEEFIRRLRAYGHH
ncbi:hypothetical protein AB0H86_41360 [Streptomyces sp. NPDC050997]|uniref:hypothetical protein n=1 Tax=Streptomyces sp. NPDC050997 TaxID=3155519 RepID=UPI00344649EB